MLSRKKIAVVSGLLGSLAVTCAGVTQANAAAGPGKCTRDIQGNITCVQQIRGEIPEDGVIPHYENCMPSQPMIVPAALGNGQMKIGPQISCNNTMPTSDKGLELPALFG
ncbi:hypothetical protein AQI88_25145 [Streptomyces cellostaticus]|uniref:Secreted protein n=1 Tax=Streptomyces cellostaticus TaxID=67285 RepID=A0A101NIB3_9ACTN|nr:hypothetical protein [Streptomyces cellostaticus]KUM93700.1 hypothetical protein AQI88_25145 [Streptomyces cellostaticus]